MVADDDNRFGTNFLWVKLVSLVVSVGRGEYETTNLVTGICDCRKIWCTRLFGVNYDGVLVGSQDGFDDLRAVCDFREARRPDDPDRPLRMHLEERKAWTDARARCDDNDGLKEQRHVDDAQRWQAFHPEVLGAVRVIDELPGPVASIGDDDRVTTRAVGIGNDSEGMVLRKWRVRNPDSGTNGDL